MCHMNKPVLFLSISDEVNFLNQVCSSGKFIFHHFNRLSVKCKSLVNYFFIRREQVTHYLPNLPE
jgi:hypothetical protein